MKNKTKIRQYMIDGNMFDIVRWSASGIANDYRYQVYKNNKQIAFEGNLREFYDENTAIFMLLSLFEVGKVERAI